MKNNVHEIKYEIKGEEWKNLVDKAWEKTSKKVKIDGFREGKVPRNIYEEKYGKMQLFTLAIEDNLNEFYIKVLEENKLIPVVEPDVNIESFDDDKAILVFNVITAPEVNVKKYKGLNVKKEEVNITNEEIQQEINKITKEYAELVNKEGSVELGDIAVINYVGTKDGIAFDGGTADNYSLKIGSNTFIPGFEENVIGMNVNETKDIDLTFPENYPAEELKGAKVTFKVTVVEIKEEKTPELNEEFFKDLGIEEVKNKEELEKFLKENMIAKKEVELENAYIDSLLKEIASNTEVEIPTKMIDAEVNRILEEFKERLAYQQLNIEDYYKWTGTTEEKLKESVLEEATSRVKSRLILDNIMKLENITASEEEIKNRVNELCKHYNMTEEELTKQFGDSSILEYEVKIKKTFDFLKENN